MYNREWFRLSLLSLYCVIHLTPASAADGGITGWIVRQSVQVIATGLGLGAVVGNELGKQVKGSIYGSGYPYGIQRPESTVAVRAEPLTVNTSGQSGAGTAPQKKISPQSNENEAFDVAYKAQLTQKSDAEVDNLLKICEENLLFAKDDVRYYKGKALEELKEHIKHCEKSLEITKAEKSARLSQQVTTVAATTAVLTNKTAGTSEPQMLEKAGEENKDRSKEKKDKKQQLPAPKDPPPHESGKNLEFIEKDKPGQHSHQWRNEGGHFKEDTPTARELIRRTVKEGNYRGVKNGKYQYDWVNPETGEQIWVETIGTKIQNHGINLKPWEVNKATGFIEAAEGYQRAPTGVVRCEATGAIIWPLVPALMDKLERDAEKPNPLPDLEVKKLATEAVNNYLKENPISGTIKMPTYIVPPTTHTVPNAYKTDGYIVPAKASTIESIMKDNGCKCKNSLWNYYTTPSTKTKSSSSSSDNIDWDELDRKSQKALKKQLEAGGDIDYAKLEAATAKTTANMIAYLNKD